mgnify:CR=1 FL=1
MDYDVIGTKEITIYNENDNISLTLLKKALAYAEEEKKLKNIELSSKAIAKILNITYIILESIIGRFILYFIVLGMIPFPKSFVASNIFIAIFAAICLIIAYFDPFDIYKKILKVTALKEKICIKTEKLKVQRDNAIKQYEIDKDNFGKLKELLGEKCGNIKYAKFLINSMETGKAKDLNEAKILLQNKIKEDEKHKRKIIRNTAIGGATVYLAIIASFLGFMLISIPLIFKMNAESNRHSWWW